VRYWRERRFALSALRNRRPRGMTHGPGPPCQRLGRGGDEEAHYRGRRFAPRVVVRLLRTRRPAHQLYDSWARAPVSETGPLFSAEMKRRTTAGGGSPSLHSETRTPAV
jgi:hypothetical protein